MPTERYWNRPTVFGPDCVFAVYDWRGFTANTGRIYGTITGTINEVETPMGIGLSVGVANSYVQIDWTSLAPLTTTPRSIFVRAYIPDNAANYVLVSYGANAVRNGFYIANNLGQYQGGFVNDMDTGGAIVAGSWSSYAVTDTGINGGANELYGQGVSVSSGLIGGNGVTQASNLFLFGHPWVASLCPVGTVIQVALVFNRVLTPAEVLDLHNACIGNKL
jgi:hypothetical protein